ncbi:MAG: isoprenylcysteine carboxylmethyltransferase family protein [Bacteroidales bacterium]|nr:isoprenylcysteine carboxylmethyltransferase family protein [Bacteroidales bacterium]
MHGVDNGGFAYGLWTVVLFSVLITLFVAFSFVKPKNKFEWRSMGAFIGFIVALFTEMYGVPLTIYFLTGWLGSQYPVVDPFSHASGHLILVFLGLSDSTWAMIILHIITNAIIFFGFYIVYKGWQQIHSANDDELVTDGIYKYIRHPQYVGMWLVTVGFLLQWPTFITVVIMWPVLMILYHRLSRREEKTLYEKFGKRFEWYKARVPAYFPRFRKKYSDG